MSERVRSRLEYIPVFETLNEAIAIYDKEKYIWVNDAYAQLRGFDSSGEIIGGSIYEGVHPSEIQENIRVIAERLRTGKNSKGFWRIQKKDGSYQKVVVHASVLPTFDNQITVAIIRPTQDTVLPTVTKGLLSHEVHSPLTVIQGYFSMLQESPDLVKTQEIENWFEIINRNIDRISEFVENVGAE